MSALATLCLPAPAIAQFIAASGSQNPATVRPGQADVAYIRITLTSTSIVAIRLTALTLTNRATGPGSQSQLDAEFGSVRLYRDDGDGVPEPTQDALLTQAVASGGQLRYSPIDVTVPALGTVSLHVIGNIPLAVRDGDVLDLSVQAASDMTFNPGQTASGFPIQPVGGFPIDGMTAAQISLLPVASDSLLAGSQSALAFGVVIPSNGYEVDQLEELAVQNSGTAAPGSDIAGVRAWVDTGDGSFDPLTDRSLGFLAFTGSRWQLTGLSESVPTNGLRVFFSVDIDDLAAPGRTVQLGLPPSPAGGVGMRSGNDGPSDSAVLSPTIQRISAADRVAWTASSLPSLAVRPGDAGVPLLEIVAQNTYSTTQVLTGLAVTNATLGGGTQADRDGELSGLTLRFDGDGDGLLGSISTDPVLGTAIFLDGRASFGGFAQGLPAGPASRLFVTGDIDLSHAADSDVIAGIVAATSDLTFSGSTRVVAQWPLDSGARATVDGMVAAQIVNFGAPVSTLGPGDGPALALDLHVPRNGYAADILDTLSVVNRGNADSSDIAQVTLWRDGGDGIFSQGSGDDGLLGPLTWRGDRWQSDLLADSIAAVGARLFVAVTVSSNPGDSAIVRLSIPVQGLRNRSGNDGPIDGAISNPNEITISNAPLLATLRVVPGSTIGQQIEVSMVVRNTSTEAVNGVVPSPLSIDGSGVLSGPSSGPIPPAVDLAPAESDTFVWIYTAAGSGDVILSGSVQGTGSPSGLPRRGLVASTNIHRIYENVSEIDLSASSSMPGTVTRGQTGVAPFSLVLTNSGTQAAPVRLTGLRFRVEDGSGNGIIPADILSGVTVSEGASILVRKTSLETSGADVSLSFATPALVDGGETLTLNLRLDISPTAGTSSLRIVAADSTWLSAQDANTGAMVVSRLLGGPYPLRSTVARLVSEATNLVVEALPSVPQRVGRGEPAVPLLNLRVESPGVTGITSDARISSFTVVLADTNGVPVAHAADYVGRIQVRTAVQVLADRTVFATDGATLTVLLNPPLSVPANTPLELAVLGDIALSGVGTFRTELGDSSAFDARDAVTGNTIPVLYTAPPLVGSAVLIERTAETIAVRGVPMLPAQLTVGRIGVPALSATLRHPGSAGTARIRADSLVIQVRNESRQPLVPATYVSRLRLLWNGTEIASRSDPPSFGGSVGISLAGSLLEPGDSAVVQLVIDITPSAPEGFLELMVFDTGIRTVDANLESNVVAQPESGAELPASSGLTRLVPPARQLVVDLRDGMPAALAADGSPISVGVIVLANPAASSSDSIFVDHLVLLSSDGSFAPRPMGASVARVQAFVNGSLWAESDALTPDSLVATLAAPTRLGVPAGQTIEIELRVLPNASERTGFRVGCDADGIGVVQPGGALLHVDTQAASGRTFPLWTEIGTPSSLTLRESYANFPNPFHAGRATTTFAYYMRTIGHVTIRVYTATGDAVATLLDATTRGPGMVQSDLWDGRNGGGHIVRNGVYIAELSVEYDDGSRERVLRKVAVLR